MKVLKSVPAKDSKLRLTVETDATENLLPVRDGAFYRLGYPLDDMVIAAHILEAARPVLWCSIEQKWVE